TVVAEARRLVPCDRSAVAVWIPERGELRFLAVARDGSPAELGVGSVLPLDQASLRPLVERRRVLRTPDLRRLEQSPWIAALVSQGLRAGLAVPVVARGRAIAILTAASRRVGIYTAEHQLRLEQLAVHLAVG